MLFRIAILIYMIFSIQACLVDNEKREHKDTKKTENKLIDTVKRTFGEAGRCLENAVATKGEKEAARMVTKQQIAGYDRFLISECTDDDLANLLKANECVRNELCKKAEVPNSQTVAIYLNSWEQCKDTPENPYRVSDACAKKTQVNERFKTPYDE